MPGFRNKIFSKGLTAVVVLLGALLVGACASGATTKPAQPAPGDTVFRGGNFDQLPRYPRSQDLNQDTAKNGVVAQTFSVANTTPQQVLQFYGDHLAGWQVAEAARSIGSNAYRGAWVKGDRELLVSASGAPTLSQQQPVVQYSLELGPVRPVP